jgi:molybdenum cofactor guanylyltransferase
MLKFDAVILAGGQSLRMGQDKGLLVLPLANSGQGMNPVTMVESVALVLNLAENLWVSSNDLDGHYSNLGFTTVRDLLHEEIGPLAGPLLGILTGLQTAKSDWVLFSPCDTPQLPKNYSQLMTDSASQHYSYANVASDGERRQNLHLLLHTSLQENLLMYMLAGGRKPYKWLDKIKAQEVDFSEFKAGFKNINSLSDI